MIGSTLACGPYFHEDALWMSLVIFLAVNSVASLLFIHAFRFRVSRPAPLRSAGHSGRMASLAIV